MKSLIALIPLYLVAPNAFAEQILPNTAVSQFEPSSLGGITSIMRYEVARPDRTEVDYLLLTAPETPKGNKLPVQIQVQALHGEAASLSDVDGADCTISKAAIFRQGSQITLAEAIRVFDAQQILRGGMSQPGPMDIHIYYRREGGDAGESSPLFQEDAPPRRTGPLCLAADVRKAIAQAVEKPASNRKTP
jgi:hypothetical protein